MKVTPEYLGIHSGNVTSWGLDIDDGSSLEAQIDELREDLGQVEYENDQLIDIGWHPSFDVNGSFKVYVIDQSRDWDSPVFKAEAKSLEDLKVVIKQAVAVVESQ